MSGGISIVGMACRFPDAKSPGELWETVLAGRRAFRRIPQERIRLEDYWSSDRLAADRTYVTEAAVLTNFEFDRVRYRVSAEGYRSADPAHWLALDCAAAALQDAGWAMGQNLDKSGVGVVVGNSLTGDYTRAASLRLRWPYVRRVLTSALENEDLGPTICRRVIGRAEARYREPFPETNAETLAGWLSNTIAGRVCNHFGFQGAGYAVDGACASSLLAVATACSALTAGDLSVAIAGGVDLSLDPFELVGFARAGALAADDMRVYDRDSAGFWPGEGCGFVVLMREAEAEAARCRVYATIRGWGVSSDGQGGLTRPEVVGQTLAVERAYRRAGYGIDSVGYFEGHGTGTAVGDQVELTVLANARRRAGASRPAAIGSIKANIGHTKAAAGVAGLIKAVMAVHRQVLPPTTGCANPHRELVAADRQMVRLEQAGPWPADAPLRAGVSAMGFGGINVHVTLESRMARRFSLAQSERQCARSDQDAELIALGADSRAALLERLDQLRSRTWTLSRAELVDLAVMLQRDGEEGPHRVALVAHDATSLRTRLDRAAAAVRDGDTVVDSDAGVFVGSSSSAPRIAFLFPGQGSPSNADGGRWARRFARTRSLYRRRSSGGVDDTRTAQPAITRAALSALRVLSQLGLEAHIAVGHSLGELIALHWGGAIDERALMRIVEARGRAMGELAAPGAMASLAADADRVTALIAGSGVCVAAYNAPSQTVVAGANEAVARVVAQARREGLDAAPLPVSHAFHSELMRPVAPALRAAVARESLAPIGRRVYSTITAGLLPAQEPLIDLLARQLVEPVRFTAAAAYLVRESDLAIEVGPGTVLARLMRACGHPAAISLDAGGASLAPLMRTVGAAYVLGAPLRLAHLAEGRFARPFELGRPRFLASPCEQVPGSDDGAGCTIPETAAERPALDPTPSLQTIALVENPLQTVLQIVASRAELPVEAIGPGDRLLADLHFNSITAAQIVLDVAARLGVAAPASPTEFADASIQELVEALTAPAGNRDAGAGTRFSGIQPWVRTFRTIRRLLPARGGRPTLGGGGWRLDAAPTHPLYGSLAVEADRRAGGGTIVCLPSEPIDDDWLRLAGTAREAVRRGNPETFVIVHDGDAGVGLGASLAEEAPQLTVVVVQVPFDVPDAGRWVFEEAVSADRFTHVCLARDGSRHSPQLEAVAVASRQMSLTADDVIVVSGGGKGIAAECALELAKRSGAALGLIGRADPYVDEGLAANLSRMRAAGIRVRYERADVSDRVAVTSAIRRVVADLGSITVIVHAAGVNRPVLLAQMSDEDVHEALAAKVAGARHLVEAVDMRRLRLFVAFGSLIARTGMRGDSHYALANEAMRLLVDRVGAAHPSCRCLTIEWSVWAGAGMGERLGRLTALERQGIASLTVDQGVDAFVKLVSDAGAAGGLVVTSRFGDTPAVKVAGPALPIARFVEAPRVWYPGIELVADSELSADTDAYLDDHRLHGDRVFPAVMGLEAMVQAAAALAGVAPGQPCQLCDIRFDQPVVVPPTGRRVVRTVALARSATEIEVALRCDVTGFAVDHFAMRCRFEPAPPDGQAARHPPGALADARDLYGDLLFQRGRFQRVSGYQELRAGGCVAEVSAAAGGAYFGGYLGRSLWLGDPGVRDGVIHAVQACNPLRRLVPLRVERLTIWGDLTGGCRVEALERAQHGATYVYDLDVWDTSGRLVERWEGLQLRDIGAIAFPDGLPSLLLHPWLEREWFRIVGDSGLKLIRLPYEMAGSGLLALRGLCADMWRRPDGRPVPGQPGLFASATHDGGTTVGVIGSAPVGCDLQGVEGCRPDDWERLLGPADVAIARHLTNAAAESFEASATRIWSAREALRKCGAAAGPLIVSACESPVVRFRSGPCLLTTTRLRASRGDTVFALVVQPSMVRA